MAFGSGLGLAWWWGSISIMKLKLLVSHEVVIDDWDCLLKQTTDDQQRRLIANEIENKFAEVLCPKMYIVQVKRRWKDGVSSELLNMAVHLLSSYSSKARAPHFWQVLGILPATWSETKSTYSMSYTHNLSATKFLSTRHSLVFRSTLSNNISSMKMQYRGLWLRNNYAWSLAWTSDRRRRRQATTRRGCNSKCVGSVLWR